MNDSNLMTNATYERLLKELEKAKDDESKAHKAIGAAAGAETDWHDNAAFDYAQMQYDFALSKLRMLKEKLANYKIIEPRQETDVVQIGNAVILEFIDDKKTQKFTILGQDDSGTKESWLSYTTPIATSVLNKSKDEIGEFEAGNQKQQIKIIEILPGEF
jgi:transcription elongation GreA/GreB family factor